MSRSATEWERPPNLPEEYYVSALVYSDEEIFKEEQEKLLRKTWKFACHESEVPEIGDYRTFDWTGIPLVTVRGADNKIRTFINSCSHRSAKIAYGVTGNVKSFVCFFHLWAYNLEGNCIGQTRDLAYEKCGPSKDQCGLREVKTETWCGMIFINLDDGSPNLLEDMGETLTQFEDVLEQTELEVFHFHRILMTANWKQWHETNMELYHEWGHPVNRRTSVHADGYFDREWTFDSNGHGVLAPFKVQYKNYGGWQNRDSKTFPGMGPGEFRIMNLFPNTSFILRTTCMRIHTTTPIAPGLTHMEDRGLGIKGESRQDRLMRESDFHGTWGPFGRNTAEDVAFVEAAEQANRHGAAKYSIISRIETSERGLPLTQDEEHIRLFFALWNRYMGRPPHNPTNVERHDLKAAE